jgi:hypothetical protein
MYIASQEFGIKTIKKVLNGFWTMAEAALLKTPSENPVGINGSRRKEYIAFANCIAHVISLKTLCEKP